MQQDERATVMKKNLRYINQEKMQWTWDVPCSPGYEAVFISSRRASPRLARGNRGQDEVQGSTNASIPYSTANCF